MSSVRYDVPLVIQARNPICWVACVAMVDSFKSNSSEGVGTITGGFDPSDSSIPNPAQSWDDFVSRISQLGYASVAIQPTTESIETGLANCGPIILSHYCVGFPYGTGWGTINDPNAMHAVVITGIDTTMNGGTCWMNNPWGNKDREIPVSEVLKAVNLMQSKNKMPFAYKY